MIFMRHLHRQKNVSRFSIHVDGVYDGSVSLSDTKVRLYVTLGEVALAQVAPIILPFHAAMTAYTSVDSVAKLRHFFGF